MTTTQPDPYVHMHAIERDLHLTWRPSHAQIASAVELLAQVGRARAIVVVPLALPGKADGWWIEGQTCEPVAGLWLVTDTRRWDGVGSYPHARLMAEHAADTHLGERDGVVSWASIHSDGTWSVQEGLRWSRRLDSTR